MKNIFSRLGLLSLILIVSIGNAAAQSQETNKNAADVLREAMKAVGNLSAVEYEVAVNDERTLFSHNSSTKVRATKTKITAANSPLRAVAKLQADDGATYEMFALNDKIMPFSAAGKIGENDLTKGIKPLTAYVDFNSTWRLLLDRELFAKVIEEGRVLYGGQESIGDDLCDVIIHVDSNPKQNIIATNYYWISTKTNLPRARQSLLMTKRGKSLSPQSIITVTKQNPPITPATFAYKPAEKDSIAPPEPKKEDKKTVSGDRELTELMGKPLPALTANDVSFQKVKLNDIIAKPTLITFWATWCGPCLKEMPFFQKLVDKHKGKFQVLAVATSEENAASIGFIKKHPEYKFTFLLDPDADAEWNIPVNAQP
ncbi:MAG TPA: redoxin family protein, partial [Pyrinomonadaceae bacterium]